MLETLYKTDKGFVQHCMPEEGPMGPKHYEVVCTQRLIWLFVCEYPRIT